MADQAVGFELLGWDSAFFGFKVAKLKFPVLDLEALGALLDELKALGVTLVYWPAGGNGVEARRVAERWGGFLADEKRTYRAVWDGAAPPKPLPPQIGLYDGDKASESLRELALRSGDYSRFKMEIGRAHV